MCCFSSSESDDKTVRIAGIVSLYGIRGCSENEGSLFCEMLLIMVLTAPNVFSRKKLKDVFAIRPFHNARDEIVLRQLNNLLLLFYNLKILRLGRRKIGR